MLRPMLIAAALAAALTPALAHADDDWRRGYGYGRPFVETFIRDGCVVERIWTGRGRFEERVDCRGGHNRWRGDDWDDGWSDRFWHDQRYAFPYFDDRVRLVLADYYGAPFAGWRRFSVNDWRRAYVIGRPLPAAVRWRPLPYDIARRLPPPPRGHRFILVDRDVLLVAEATKLVIDAAVLLSAR